MKAVRVAGGLFTVLALHAGVASAQPTGEAKELARSAYARGATALEHGDFETAANEFLRADEALPSSVAKKSALDAAVRTDDVPLAARVLNRTASLHDDVAFAGPRRDLEERLGPKLARLRFECRASSCTVTVEGTRIADREMIWLTAGRHVASTTIDGLTGERTVDAVAGKLDTLTLGAPAAPAVVALPPPAPPAPKPAESKGISPAWFWASAGLTVVVGGVATWSTIRLFSKHSDFVDGSCATVGSTSCKSISHDGKSAETRTVILLGATGALAAATAVTGLFFVRWHDQRVGLAPVPGGGAVALGGSWR